MNDLLAYLLLWWAMTRRTRTGLDVTKLVWPVRVDGKVGRGGSTITQEYRPPSHLGVDIAVPGHYRDAGADVLAVARGTVARSVRGPRGWFVLLSHEDWASSYLHMSAIDVKLGDVVEAGQRIGRMGADPTDAEGIVHLHLQIAPLGKTTDPAPYLQGRV